MTPAETPTECAACVLPTDLFDAEAQVCAHHGLIAEKDARIRELEGVLIGIKDTLRALARSEGGGA